MFGDELKKRQKGTGFTNIGKIMGANVGAGQQMAGKIAQGIQSAGQKAQQQLGQAQQQFKTGFQTATQPVLGTMTQAGGLAKRTDESDEDYAKRIQSSGVDYSQIGKKVAEAKYGGPMGLDKTQDLLGGAVGAGQLGAFTTSGLGQQQLAKQFAASRGAGYTKGQASLDQLLLGQSPEAQAQLKQARESVAGLPEQTMSAARSALAQAAGMQTGIEKEKSRVLGGIQSSVGELEQRASERGQQYSRDAQRIVNLLRDPSSLGKISGAGGRKFDQQQAEYDKKLLKNISKFGLEATGEAIDTSDPEAMIEALQEIANKGTTGISKKYGDPQKAALQKLAQFQQDEGRAAQIAAQKDKSAFEIGKEEIKQLTPIKRQAAEAEDRKNKAIEAGQKYKALADEFQQVYNIAHQIPREDLRQEAEDRAFDALARKYGFNPAELANVAPTKGQVLEYLRSMPSQFMRQYEEDQAKREKNKMTLENYINKLYGLS